jgi:8-oxo-dGTP diphosphatase
VVSNRHEAKTFLCVGLQRGTTAKSKDFLNPLVGEWHWFTPMSKRDYPTSPRVAVGAVVFKENRVLLVKRDNPPGKGLWAIPGGRVKLGETLQVAAERETREETGVIIRAKDPVYTFDVIERDARGRIRFHYVIVDLLADYISGKPNPGSDACDARWIAHPELDEIALSPSTRKFLKEKIQFSC